MSPTVQETLLGSVMAIARIVRDTSTFQYDVCLSFAGEQREYVREVADALRVRVLRVFFDEYEKVNLWGKDLYSHLDEIYQHLARYCVLFVSAEYAAKVWTSHERRSAQARAIAEQHEYVLPARFDSTEVPGLPATIGYIDIATMPPGSLAQLIVEKVGSPARQHYLPPVPDRLFDRLGIEDDPDAQEQATAQAHRFLDCLQRMSEPEREVVFMTMLHGCPAELPDNVHIYVDLLRRLTGFSGPKLKRLLGGLRSLGFSSSVRASHDEKHAGSNKTLGEAPLFQVEWSDLAGLGEYPEMLVAVEMISGALEGYCEQHGFEALRRLDFSQLATVTTSEDHHHVSAGKKRSRNSRSKRPAKKR